MKPLTAREKSCLYWAAQGKTSWEIGTILGIKERTANFHIANVCAKLGVNTRQAAISIALEVGLLTFNQTDPFSARSRSLAQALARRPAVLP